MVKFVAVPSPPSLLFLIAWSALVLTAGVVWFRRTSYRFADEL